MSNPQHLKERLTEAARYALLRRLAPALRHNIAGTLQPISMMAAMLEKRLQKPEPDMAALVKNSTALNSLSREAARSCMSLMSWLAPKDNGSEPLGACVEDAVGLVATELSFRGFGLVNETAHVQASLPRSVVRNAFLATLIALTDSAVTPATILLTAKQTDDELVLGITLAAADGEPMPGGAANIYREVQWDDARALAEAESVALTYATDHAELRYHITQESEAATLAR
jgi:hypothetical protein